ncbi:uncharacterized protein F5147DRAFT_767172 [Suillus discolor]|uniref:Uncharacterized protein n=1 Tax=Suillus discolor TaxID=1912936 RepID=A0A9P7JZZ7_9AGAM|nr:uncharacterized protein F5147DRAFT_767172 [Suillus discolor]KAG2119702.1 hypothetical protein F5147DRAFT_767172 [Suillus discolor]
MAPPRWTTSEELEWLQNELPEFLKMQKDQKLTRFYELLFPRWFSQFPECLKYWKPTSNPPPCEGEAVVHQNDDSSDANISDKSRLLPLTPEQEAELEEEKEIRWKKLREWFWNHAKSKTTLGNTSTSKAFAQLLGQRSHGVRDLKAIEVYSKTHYKMKIQSLVEDDIQQNQLDSKKRIGVVQKYINSCFAAESEDVKAVICEETVQINASRRLGGIGSGEHTKEEIYHAIQELPIVLGQICEDLAVLTGGWHYTIVMEGPDPMCQGDIMTLSFHHGKGQDGLSFKASRLNFHEQYLVPFEQHLRTVFGRPLVESSLSSSILKPHLPVPSNSTSPNAQNNSAVEPPSSVQANSNLNAGPNFSEMYTFPQGSLMDPNFPVAVAEIEKFISSIPPLIVDSPDNQWWNSQSQDMQMAAPPLINPPLTVPGSPIELPMQGQNNSLVSYSSTPPCICRPHLNDFASPLSMSPRLPPVDSLHTANNEGHSLPAAASPRLPPADSLHTANNEGYSLPAATNSDSLPSVCGIPAPLKDATAIPTVPDVLLNAGSVPPTSGAPGRRSIGDNTKPLTSKCKRKGAASGSTAHPVAVKKSKK